MRILIYGINFAPEMVGIGKYSGEMAEWLAARGHEVEVVTAPPYYPAWRVAEGYSARWYRGEWWGPTGRVQVTRCPLWVPTRVTGKRRLLHLASFAASSALALVWALRRRPDMVFVVAPTLMTAPFALAAARMLGVPIWLHIQDFEIDAMFGMGIIDGRGGLARAAFALEAAVMRRFTRVSSISTRMCAWLLAKGVDPVRVVEFPNWVDLSLVYPLAGANVFRTELGLGESEVMVLYSGNMGEKQGLEALIEVAARLVDRINIRFVLVGTGAARERLERAAVGLPNITWLPLQPSERLNEMLNAADIHVLPQRADAADLVMPSKLTGMLASGRVVVGTAHADTQLGEVLQACGVCVKPEDSAMLAEEIAALADDASRRTELGQRGRAYAEQHLARDTILSRLEAEFIALVRTRERVKV